MEKRKKLDYEKRCGVYIMKMKGDEMMINKEMCTVLQIILDNAGTMTVYDLAKAMGASRAYAQSLLKDCIYWLKAHEVGFRETKGDKVIFVNPQELKK